MFQPLQTATLAILPVLALQLSGSGGHASGPQNPRPRGPVDVGQLPVYLPRSLAVRAEPGSGDGGATGPDGWIETLAREFVRVPKMAASVVVEEDDTNLAITFTAEAYVVGPPGTRLFVRARIDDVVAEPADVVFTQDVHQGTRSFTFTDVLDAGIHTVEIDWMVDDLGSIPRAYMRAATLELRTGKDTNDQDGTLTIHTAPSGGTEDTRFTAWNPVPDMEIPFYAPADCSVVVTFSAEAAVDDLGDSFILRATVDGQALEPNDVIFARTDWFHARMMVFGKGEIDSGWHDLSIDWSVANVGETAYCGDRTVVISCYPKGHKFSQHFRSPPSGAPIATSGADFEDVAGLSQTVSVPINGELSVKVSAEAWTLGDADLRLRLSVGNKVIDEETIALAVGGWPLGVQSFVFDRKHVLAGWQAGQNLDVVLQWAVEGPGTALMGDRSMAIVCEPEDIPDLAEAPPFGIQDGGVEPAIGSRKVLMIFWDPHRPDHPAGDKQTIIDSIFGASESVKDYFEVMSGGRFTIENAGTLGYYDAYKDADHYFGEHVDCDDNDDEEDLFAGGHAEKWWEAIDQADADYDFAAYDVDNDGVLEFHELAILMVVPQSHTYGSFRSSLQPYCNDDFVYADGVHIKGLTEWYVSDPREAEDDRKAFSTAAHEFGHHLLALNDMYVKTDVGMQYPNQDTYTEPGFHALMAANSGSTPHMDPMHKLALGWATPTWIDESDTYELEQVRVSREIAVLPNKGGDGREYFLLEHRRSGTYNQPELYDEGVAGLGIVIWHVIESPLKNCMAPACMDQQEWLDKTNNNVRRGVRVLRRGIEFSGTGNSVWSLEEGYDLGWNLTCPNQGTPRNVLRWADGSHSRYLLGDFSTEWPETTMSFYVHVVGG